MYLPPAFDKAMALEAAALVNQAYDQFQQFKLGQAWNLAGNYNELGLLNARPEWSLSHEPFGFVAQNRASGLVFIVYRGTETPSDWLVEFTFPQVPQLPGAGNVESGFYGVYQQTAGSVAAAVARAGAKPNVIATGHSLGGALAVLAAGDPVTSAAAGSLGLYTFAGPRTGDLAFAAAFNGRVRPAWRVVNTEDIVPTLPLATPVLVGGSAPLILRLAQELGQKLNYEHAGTAVCFTTHTGSIAGNHSMQVYIAAIQGAQATAPA